MPAFKPAKLLRILCSEDDQCQGKPLYKAVVDKCMEMKIAGATVFRGAEGYGESAEIHRGRLLTHNHHRAPFAGAGRDDRHGANRDLRSGGLAR